MTNYSKFKSLSIAAGVTSLFFGFSVVLELDGVAYARWSFLKTFRDLGLGYRPSAVPHLTPADLGRLAFSTIIAIAAFYCRSHLRSRMKLEPITEN